MFSTEDTIVAIATPPGPGGLGVVRISGSQAHAVARQIVTRKAPFTPRHATLTAVRRAGRAVDQAIVTFFERPGSYTGEDVVELSAHGSPVVLRQIVACAVDAGARMAEPGEFTLRAFLNGRIDLPQAEAVADLIDAVTPLQARVAYDQLQGTLTAAIGGIDAQLFDLIAKLEASVDFPDEGYHFVDPNDVSRELSAVGARIRGLIERGRAGRLIREGRVVAIVGGPNVGKSSLFNALVGSARAIVTPVPGTTRDLVSETIDLGGLRVTLVDTAGVRETTDAVELEGVTRSVGVTRIADVVIWVRDGADRARGSDYSPDPSARAVVTVDNKCDLAGFEGTPEGVAVSAATGAGVPQLESAVLAAIGHKDYGECPEITNIRHLMLLEQASDAIQSGLNALSSAHGSLSEEFLLADLQVARAALEEISGKRSADDVLEHIFQRFCIGK
jgi:tRNA modification GTPase